jgi:hypothetical protein
MKLKGDKWIGFSIDIYGAVKGFLNDELTTEFKKHPYLFENIKRGSFVVMELREAKTESGQDITQPLKFGELTQIWDIYQNQRDEKGKYIFVGYVISNYETKIQFARWPIFAHMRPIKKRKKRHHED